MAPVPRLRSTGYGRASKLSEKHKSMGGRIPSLRGGTAKNSCLPGGRRGPQRRTAAWSWPVTTAASITAAMPSVAWRNDLRSHEGVVARAMEKKGIISDRCELNRQIKADNALLRELDGGDRSKSWPRQSKIPSRHLPRPWKICEKICCCSVYQLGYLRKGKERTERFAEYAAPLPSRTVQSAGKGHTG